MRVGGYAAPAEVSGNTGVVDEQPVDSQKVPVALRIKKPKQRISCRVKTQRKTL